MPRTETGFPATVATELIITVAGSGSESYYYDMAFGMDGGLGVYLNRVVKETPIVIATGERNEDAILGEGIPALQYRPFKRNDNPDLDESVNISICGKGTPATTASALSMLPQLESEDYRMSASMRRMAGRAVTAALEELGLERQEKHTAAEPLETEEDQNVGEVVTVTVVPDREPVAWDEEHVYTQSELLLNSEIELVAGDTVDITGTVESYISGYLLTKNSKDSVVYLNTNKGGIHNEIQPYITMPVYKPEDTEEEADPVPPAGWQPVDEAGLLVKESDFTITSSNPNIVTVNGYTLTAMDGVGRAVVRIYNKSTKRSVMLVIHVLNVDDYVVDETQYIYRATPSISLGDSFSVALKAEGTVWTWGSNASGALGLGLDDEDQISPVLYVDSPSRVVREDGSVLRSVVDISAGKDHVLAVTREGKVYAWGSNSAGQLGAAPFGDAAVVKSISAREVDVSGVRGKVVRVAAGNGYSILLTDKGTVWGFGRNDKGQLGVGYTHDVVGYDPV